MDAPAKRSLSAEIGRFAAGLRFDDLPADVVEKLKICLYFNLGIAVAGAPLVGEGIKVVSQFPLRSTPAARVFVEGSSLPPSEAAFANALMMHARAQDDFQHCANAHIGTIATPATLALGEWRNVDGRTFLTAMAIAYQVATVLGDGFCAITTPRGFRASGIYGTPGAAAGCARVLGLDEAKCAHAVGLAASLASGLGQPWVSGSMEWRLQVAQASRNAVFCALLADAGHDAAPDIYEGRYGFYAAHAETSPDVEAMIASLRGSWRTESVAFKPLPVCAVNQGPARNAIDLVRSGALDANRIASIEIELPGEDVAYPGIAATGPITSAGSALMRTAYVVAVCLARGRLRQHDLDHRDDSNILALAERTRIVANEGLSPLSHVLRIATSDHKTYERPYQASGREFILDRSQIREIFEGIRDELALPLERIDRLADTIWRLDRDSDPTDLVSQLVAGDAVRQARAR